MKEELYPRTGTYRILYHYYQNFFKDIRLPYGKQICQETKRKILENSSLPALLKLVEKHQREYQVDESKKGFLSEESSKLLLQILDEIIMPAFEHIRYVKHGAAIKRILDIMTDQTMEVAA